MIEEGRGKLEWERPTQITIFEPGDIKPLTVKLIKTGKHGDDLFVDPVLLSRLPGHKFLRLEPECNLVVGRLNSIRSVTDVASNLDCKVSPDSSWLGVSRVCFTKHHTTSLHCVEPLPDHGDHGAAGHVLH